MMGICSKLDMEKKAMNSNNNSRMRTLFIIITILLVILMVRLGTLML